jgi:tetratricopeptide (TPR) repeat protein
MRPDRVRTHPGDSPQTRKVVQIYLGGPYFMKKFLCWLVVLAVFLPHLAAAQSVEAYVNQGIENSQNGRYDQALKDFNQALKLKPRDPTLLTYRGVVYYAKGQYEKAMQDYNQALAIDPKFGRAYYQRGMIYENQEKYAQAVAEMKKAKSSGWHVDPVWLEILETKAAAKKKQ